MFRYDTVSQKVTRTENLNKIAILRTYESHMGSCGGGGGAEVIIQIGAIEQSHLQLQYCSSCSHPCRTCTARGE